MPTTKTTIMYSCIYVFTPASHTLTFFVSIESHISWNEKKKNDNEENEQKRKYVSSSSITSVKDLF